MNAVPVLPAREAVGHHAPLATFLAKQLKACPALVEWIERITVAVQPQGESPRIQ